jgi:ubiquitin-protein ligase
LYDIFIENQMHPLQIKRVSIDLRGLAHYKSEYWDAKPRGDDLRKWDCVIMPHYHSKYGHENINLMLTISTSYPLEPPHISIITPLIHPCVSQDGLLRLFDTDWTPAYSIGALMTIITALFNDYDDAKVRQVERTQIYKFELFQKMFAKDECSDF